MANERDERYRDRITDLPRRPDEDDEPRVYALERRGGGWGISRRSMLRLAAAAATAGCATTKEAQAPPGCGEAFAHTDWIRGLALSPDGTLLASGSRDLTVKLWAMPAGGLVRTLEGHANGVHALAISGDGRLLASGSLDGTVGLWSLPEGERTGTLEPADGPVVSVALSPDGSLVAAGVGGGRLRLWRLPGGEEVTIPGDEPIAARSLALTPQGDLLAGAGSEGGVELRSLPGGDLVATLEAAGVGPLAIHPEGAYLAGGARDGTIHLWSLPDGEPAASWRPHDREVECLAFVGDGQRLASASSEAIVLSSVPGGLQLARAEAGQVKALTADPEGAFLVSAGIDKTVRIWRLPDLQQERCLMDLEASPQDSEGIEVEVEVEGRTETYTLPCGSPIPPGAVCICNCVPGSWDGVTKRRAPVAVPRAQPIAVPESAPAPAPSLPTVQETCTCVPVHYWYPN
jgi:predicted NUDIX family NTP pyrophosphohydrolase